MIEFFSFNAGAQWVSATSNPPYLAYDMGFFKSKTGISLNEDNNSNPDVRRTTDGGQSWTTVNMSKYNYLSRPKKSLQV